MLYKGDEASIPIPDATRRFWKGIWRFQVPRKIKHFMWKACRNALPTKVNLVRQKIQEVHARTVIGVQNPLLMLCGSVNQYRLFGLCISGG